MPDELHPSVTNASDFLADALKGAREAGDQYDNKGTPSGADSAGKASPKPDAGRQPASGDAGKGGESAKPAAGDGAKPSAGSGADSGRQPDPAAGGAQTPDSGTKPDPFDLKVRGVEIKLDLSKPEDRAELKRLAQLGRDNEFIRADLSEKRTAIEESAIDRFGREQGLLVKGADGRETFSVEGALDYVQRTAQAVYGDKAAEVLRAAVEKLAPSITPAPDELAEIEGDLDPANGKDAAMLTLIRRVREQDRAAKAMQEELAKRVQPIEKRVADGDAQAESQRKVETIKAAAALHSAELDKHEVFKVMPAKQRAAAQRKTLALAAHYVASEKLQFPDAVARAVKEEAEFIGSFAAESAAKAREAAAAKAPAPASAPPSMRGGAVPTPGGGGTNGKLPAVGVRGTQEQLLSALRTVRGR